MMLSVETHRVNSKDKLNVYLYSFYDVTPESYAPHSKTKRNVLSELWPSSRFKFKSCMIIFIH